VSCFGPLRLTHKVFLAVLALPYPFEDCFLFSDVNSFATPSSSVAPAVACAPGPHTRQ